MRCRRGSSVPYMLRAASVINLERWSCSSRARTEVLAGWLSAAQNASIRLIDSSRTRV